MVDVRISEMLTYSTVQIHCEYDNGTSGSGTGFIINLCENKEKGTCVPVLVTNNHVVENSKKTVLEFCLANEKNEPIDTKTFTIELSDPNWVKHPDNTVDLRCLALAPLLNVIEKLNKKIFYVPINSEIIPNDKQLQEFSALEDLVMVGYPIGLSDEYNHKPVLRKGTTATHMKNDYQGKKEFLMDMACYPGSSGSPVFIYNDGTYTTPSGELVMGSRIYFVGVLYGGPHYSASGTITFSNLPNIPKPVINIPINLGIAIKSERVLEFENLFKNGR